MLEIRFHGRGGQGAKTAATLLAETAMNTGKYIQAFPEYGPERSGAPVKSFVRTWDEPITIHSAIQNPDIVVVIDPTLLEVEDVTQGLAENGILVINIDEKPDRVRSDLDFSGGTVATVNATDIAIQTLGKPITNIPMLGALLKAYGIVDVEELQQAIKDTFEEKLGREAARKNIDGLKRAYEEVQIDE